MLIKFNRLLFEYQLIVLFAKIFGLPKYRYTWYETAIKVKKDDLTKFNLVV